MSRPYQGQAPKGATITSAEIEAMDAIDAGDIEINGVAFPAVAEADDVEHRVDQLVALFNAHFTLTGVWATKVDASSYKLDSGAAIAATLGSTATEETCGFETEIDDPLDGQVLLASGNRVKFGTGLVTGDDAYINYGSQDINVKHAKAMGLLGVAKGADI